MEPKDFNFRGALRPFLRGGPGNARWRDTLWGGWSPLLPSFCSGLPRLPARLAAAWTLTWLEGQEVGSDLFELTPDLQPVDPPVLCDKRQELLRGLRALKASVRLVGISAGLRGCVREC